MKKIAIVTKKMVMGGIEKALLGMIGEIIKKGDKVTLYLQYDGGALRDKVPKEVEVIILLPEGRSIKREIVNHIKEKNIIKAANKLRYLLKSKTNDFYKSEVNMCKNMLKKSDEYDIAIAYSTPISFAQIYVIDNINAKKKITWIHSDMEMYSSWMDQYVNYFNRFDKIFSVSKEGVESVKKYIPSMKNKVDVLHNRIVEGEIQNIANRGSGFRDNFDGERIVTVGRLSAEKGQVIIPKIVSGLIKDGYNIRWYLIGEGDLRREIEEEIEKYKVKENVKLLGNLKNPYKLIKESDIYVQTSENEGYCNTITEAKCLKKAIISTEFNCIKEQIRNDENGIVCTKESIKDRIEGLINNEKVKDDFIENLKKEKIDTRDEIEKIYEVI